ncbi:MAG: hypothetical protein U9N49_00035 [Campylobacterota bacterium]|nr:hypothetical protein [Campylobacterota bacterium]
MKTIELQIEEVSDEEQRYYEEQLSNMTPEDKEVASNDKIIVETIVNDIDFRGDVYK